jgi:hypothetical protein
MRQPGAGVYQVLAVVEEQEQALVPQVVDEHLVQGASRLLMDAQRGSHGLLDEGRIGQGRQLHQPGAPGKVVEQIGSHLQRQAGLARAARPGEGQQARRREQALDFGHLALAAHKAGELDRQVVGIGCQGADGRKIEPQAGAVQLEDVLDAGNVAQPVLAQVDQLRFALPEQGSSGGRQEDLPAVGGGHQPRGAVDGRPVIIAVAQLGLAGMERHTGAEGARVSPGLGLQPLLRGDGRLGGRRGRGKGGVQSIARLLDHGPAVGIDGLPEQGIMPRQGRRHGPGMRFPEAGAGLQVAEEKSHGARGQHPTSLPSF